MTERGPPGPSACGRIVVNQKEGDLRGLGGPISAAAGLSLSAANRPNASFDSYTSVTRMPLSIGVTQRDGHAELVRTETFLFSRSLKFIANSIECLGTRTSCTASKFANIGGGTQRAWDACRRWLTVYTARGCRVLSLRSAHVTSKHAVLLIDSASAIRPGKVPRVAGRFTDSSERSAHPSPRFDSYRPGYLVAQGNPHIARHR